MKRLLFSFIGLLALVVLANPIFPSDSFASPAAFVTSADAVPSDSHDRHHLPSGSPEFCASSVGQHCSPLAAQLKYWAFTATFEARELPIPGSDQLSSRISPEPATPPPRG